MVTILGISIIAEGLRQTGVAYRLGQQMKRLAGAGEVRLIVVVMLAGATLSLFMNNIAAMAVLLPATLGLARQTRRSPARLMMPLAFGVIVGGMATLFTTSNIIASSTLREAGLKPFGVLDFLPVGLPLVILAVLYMVLIGRRILPKQEKVLETGRITRSREDTPGSLPDQRVALGRDHPAGIGHGRSDHPAGRMADEGTPECTCHPAR